MFQIIVSPDLYFGNWVPAWTAYIADERCPRTCFRAYLCECMWLTHKHTYAPKSHSVIRMSQSLPLYFSKRKGGEFTKIYLQKVTADSPTVCRFIFCSAPPPPLSHSRLYLPSLSVRLPPNHFHHTSRGRPAFPRQLRRAAISLSHLIPVRAFFSGRGEKVPPKSRPQRRRTVK